MHLQLHICSTTPLRVAAEWFLDFLELRWFLLPTPLKAYLLKQPIRQTSDPQKKTTGSGRDPLNYMQYLQRALGALG